MAVRFVNQRVLTGITATVKIAVLQQLIADLDPEQDVEVTIHAGYNGGPLDSSPASVDLTVRNPRPDTNTAHLNYPPGVR